MKNLSKKSMVALLAIALFATVFTACKKESLKNTDVKGNFNIYGKFPGSLTPNGLIAYWPLDSNGVDRSGNGHNGTYHNITTVSNRFGVPGKAAYFDGSTSYITIPDDTVLRLHGTDFTVTGWIKLDSYNPSYGSNILSKHYNGADNGWGWSITGNASSSNGLMFFGPGGSLHNSFGANITVDTTQWHMVTSVYDATAQTLTHYVDGVLDNTTYSIPSPNGAINAALNIGYDNPTGLYYFHGKMDELRIYGRALTANEIQGLFDEPDPTKFIAYWPFDGNANDVSGNGNNGTVNGASLTSDRFGSSNKAYYFDGSTSYITVADNTPLRLNGTDFTVTGWFKLDSYNSSYGSNILSKHYSGADNGWGWSVTGYASPSTGLMFFGPGGSSHNSFGANLTVDTVQWHMLTSVYNASAQTLSHYVDGVLDNVTYSIPSPNAFINASLNIGYDAPTGLYYFNGKMDEIKITAQALSPYAIAAIFNDLYK